MKVAYFFKVYHHTTLEDHQKVVLVLL